VFIVPTIAPFLVRGQVAFGYLIPTFGAHNGLNLKTTPIMPPRWQSQHLHLDEGLPQTSAQNQPPLHHPSTQNLPTITEAPEHLAFSDIPEI
jgi:hypothetical protein